MDEAAGSMPATSIFCRTHITYTHIHICIYTYLVCVCFCKTKEFEACKQEKHRVAEACVQHAAPQVNRLQHMQSLARPPLCTWRTTLGMDALCASVCICISPPVRYVFAPAPCAVAGTPALCAWHAASGMRCVRIMHIISSPCAAGKCGEEKPDRYMYPKIAPLDVRYSLVGQDTALSPRRPGFDSRYRNSMWYFYHTGIRPCTDVV